MRLRPCLAAMVFATVPLTGWAQSEPIAVAEMHDRDGREIGKVVFRQTAAHGVAITAGFISGGLPAGQHGFHVHEKGACAPDFAAAGDHFAPEGHQHGVLALRGAHAGDLPNLHIPKTGEHVVEFFAAALSLEPRTAGNLLDEDGSAVVVHAKPDDYKSQPSGDAGDRIACGVIRRAS
ncbi:superoxide dismutase family protein [Desertibaculum subflavum]|uniref:superoxide dismutase family protein n=1 Tax=Desertibaculum subflavum TaxID=2268458 RepID=UPI000E665CA4